MRAISSGITLPVPTAVMMSNEQQRHVLVAKVVRHHRFDLNSEQFALRNRLFKRATDDLRATPTRHRRRSTAPERHAQGQRLCRHERSAPLRCRRARPERCQQPERGTAGHARVAALLHSRLRTGVDRAAATRGIQQVHCFGAAQVLLDEDFAGVLLGTAVATDSQSLRQNMRAYEAAQGRLSQNDFSPRLRWMFDETSMNHTSEHGPEAIDG